MHYYQHNIADYRKDTGHLTLLEHGIYRQLLDTYYLDEKPIETHSVIRRLSIRTEEEKTALENVLSDFFTLSDCGKFHYKKRCDAEIEKYQSKAATARANGSKGGRPKKPKKTQSVNSANPEKSESKANHKPLTNKPITNSKSARFKKPTLEKLRAYCMEQGLSVDCEYFFNYYESNGWKVGRNAMKNWQLTLKNWHSRDSKKIKPISDKSVGNVDTAVDWATQ